MSMKPPQISKFNGKHLRRGWGWYKNVERQVPSILGHDSEEKPLRIKRGRLDLSPSGLRCHLHDRYETSIRRSVNAMFERQAGL